MLNTKVGSLRLGQMVMEREMGQVAGIRVIEQSELSPFKNDKSLTPGDTIEVHYVYSSADVQPGSTLGACMADGINNPALRVEGWCRTGK